MNAIGPRRFALWLAPAATLAGAAFHQTWRATAWPRPVELLAALGTTALLAIALRSMARVSLPVACAIAWAILLSWFAGISAVLSVVLMVAAALGVGSLLGGTRTPVTAWLAIPAGLAMGCGLIGWLLPFPVHHRVTYLLLLSLVVALRREAIADFLRQGHAAALRAVDRAPYAAGFAFAILAMASTSAWLPTLQADDTAYHLGLPYELQTLGYARLDASTSIWSLAAWSADVFQAIAQVLAGQESRGAVNAAWLVLCCLGTWHLGRLLHLSPTLRWMSIAALASLPLVSALLGGMQTELPGVAAALALAVALLSRRGCMASRMSLIAVLGAFLLALKISNALLLLPFGIWFLVAMRGKWRARPLVRALPLALLACGSSYSYAWWLTGNPVLPMLNGVFGSSYFVAKNWSHSMWMTGVDWTAPWLLMFKTSRFFESVDGAGGLLVLASLAGTLLALTVRRARAVALVALAGCVLTFAAIQYFRYLLPSLALMLPIALAGFARLRLERETCIAVGALTIGNAWLMPTAMWPNNRGALRTTVLEGADAALKQFAPYRAFAERIRSQPGQPQVLVLDGMHLSELAGRAYAAAWIDPALERAVRQADRDTSGEAWRHLLGTYGIDLVATTMPPSPAFLAGANLLHAAPWPAQGRIRAWSIARESLPSRVRRLEGVDRWEVEVSHPVDTGVFDVEVGFECGSPLASVGLAWSRRGMDGQEHDFHWEWAQCGDDMRALGVRRFTGTSEPGVVLLRAEPVAQVSVRIGKVTALPRAMRAQRDAARRTWPEFLRVYEDGAARP